uniref:Putative secreted peptide n=1 Tax=Anopheles braziliensis TaxID=58242 RepID=A0A2M3ZTV6_9DIPT
MRGPSALTFFVFIIPLPPRFWRFFSSSVSPAAADSPPAPPPPEDAPPASPLDGALPTFSRSNSIGRFFSSHCLHFS